MTPTISRKLNIVLPPFESKDGSTVYVHSIPVGRSVFESCFRPMSRAFSAILSEGSPLTGPNVAKLYLQDEADRLGEGEKVRGTLLPEIKRLTNVGILGKENIPYGVATQRGFIDEDQQSEVENFLVYFTLVSWLKLPDQLGQSMGLDSLRELWKAQTTSLELTAFMRGLPTSTPVENTGEKPTTPKAAPTSSLAA